MSAEKATAIVVRGTDWSETSRIATLWSREFGKLRVLAKGGRRLKSNYESALDLLNVCSIVLLRKSSGGLDLLTEAQVVDRFPRLRTDMQALYAGYYVAEMLSDWTEDYDPHPRLYDEAIETLSSLGSGTPEDKSARTSLRVARFECVLLEELGYAPILDRCTGCEKPVKGYGWTFSPSAGGMNCRDCGSDRRDRMKLSPDGWKALTAQQSSGEAWQQSWSMAARKEMRRLLNGYVTYLMGRPPRLLPYLGS